jgi:hypothetical protein
LGLPKSCGSSSYQARAKTVGGAAEKVGIMRLKLGGKFWSLCFQKHLKRRQKVRGFCESPETVGKRIVVDADLDGEELLEVLLHEQLHALFWHLDEEFVAAAGVDLARNLYRLGFRREKE